MSPYDAMLKSSPCHAPLSPVSSGHWERFRRAPKLEDQRLNHEATEWVLQLPMMLRPASTCARYPRIVNRIVEHWLRADQCRYLFETLLRDCLPSRRGFPLSVREELQALAAYRFDGLQPVASD